MNQNERKSRGNYRWLLVLAFVVITAGLAADSIVVSQADHGGFFSIPGFWSVFGLVGCLCLAGACKLVARFFLKRPENYYDDVL